MSKHNKITFNEQKSKAMVVTRKKRRENKEILIYLHRNRQSIPNHKGQTEPSIGS